MGVDEPPGCPHVPRGLEGVPRLARGAWHSVARRVAPGSSSPVGLLVFGPGTASESHSDPRARRCHPFCPGTHARARGALGTRVSRPSPSVCHTGEAGAATASGEPRSSLRAPGPQPFPGGREAAGVPGSTAGPRPRSGGDGAGQGPGGQWDVSFPETDASPG